MKWLGNVMCVTVMRN